MITIDLTENIHFAGTDVVLVEKDINNNTLFKLILTNGDFDGVIDWIPFNETLDNESFIYKYKTDIDYAQEGFRQIIRLQEFYNQLIVVTNLIHSNFLPYFDALKQICHSTLMHGNRLFIKFE